MERRNYGAAEQAAKKLLETSGPEREEAKQVRASGGRRNAAHSCLQSEIRVGLRSAVPLKYVYPEEFRSSIKRRQASSAESGDSQSICAV